jgi:hypothetical protein
MWRRVPFSAAACSGSPSSETSSGPPAVTRITAMVSLGCGGPAYSWTMNVGPPQLGVEARAVPSRMQASHAGWSFAVRGVMSGSLRIPRVKAGGSPNGLAF